MQFLLDGMLGKLTRWLRMLGYDAVYQNDSSDTDLLTAAKSKSLILLTSDEELYRTATFRGIQSFLIRGKTEPERLAELAERYELRLEIDPSKSLCPKCGSSLREIEKQNIQNLVPEATFKVYRTFWMCTNPNCAKIYWHGSHWKKIEGTLQAAKKLLGIKPDPTSN